MAKAAKKKPAKKTKAEPKTTTKKAAANKPAKKAAAKKPKKEPAKKAEKKAAKKKAAKKKAVKKEVSQPAVVANNDPSRMEVLESLTVDDFVNFLSLNYGQGIANGIVELLNGINETVQALLEAGADADGEPAAETEGTVEADEVTGSDETATEGEVEVAVESQDGATDDPGFVPEGEEGEVAAEGEEVVAEEGETAAEEEEISIEVDEDASGEAADAAPAEKPAAAKKAPSKKKAKETVEENSVFDFSQFVTEAQVGKSAEAIGKAKPSVVAKDLGVKIPKAFKSDAEKMHFAATVVAAKTKLDSMKLPALEKLAAEYGIEIAYGRTRKDDAKHAIAVTTMLTAGAEAA